MVEWCFNNIGYMYAYLDQSYFPGVFTTILGPTYEQNIKITASLPYDLFISIGITTSLKTLKATINVWTKEVHFWGNLCCIVWLNFGEHLQRDSAWSTCATSPILIDAASPRDMWRCNAEATKGAGNTTASAFWSSASALCVWVQFGICLSCRPYKYY